MSDQRFRGGSRGLLGLGLILGVLAGRAQGQEPAPAGRAESPSLTAIDVLLEPGPAMVEAARAANAKLRANFAAGFALDAEHTPHISVAQRYVRTDDLPRVYEAVRQVAATARPTEWRLRATGYYALPVENLGLAGIVVERSPELAEFQRRVLDAVAAFAVEGGTAAAFVAPPDGQTIIPAAVAYVNEFVPKYSGADYNPHVTVGLGHDDFVHALIAAPFQPFEFSPAGVAVYHLGNFGTAQRQLWSSTHSDPLPSWNEGAAKRSILEFVAKTTTPGGPRFVPPAERIATFDNDGTLWCEQPMYVQLVFGLDRVRQLAPQHPQWDDNPAYVALRERRLDSLGAAGEKQMEELLAQANTGMTSGEYEKMIVAWLATARHPRFDRPYTELVYQPMLELLAYLRANQFKTFIVSGGGIEFMRPWTNRVYRVPPEQVVGSSVKLKYELRPSGPVLLRLPEINFIDDKAGKPVGIAQYIGRRPVAAFGNSDGDQQMLEWTAGGDGASLMLLVHHDDARREYAYDRRSQIGRLDKAWDEAVERGWTVVSMQRDWKRIFPFEETPAELRK
ncbi:MAG: haloacid dehalogenase-like hydrolase [Pirellulales bacterium]